MTLRTVTGLFAVLLAAACTSDLPVKEPALTGMFENACLPEAIIMKGTLQKANIESRILIIHANSFNHATLVYVYPNEKPKVWVWDAASKSREINASFDNPLQIAKAWLADQRSDNVVLQAEFL